MKDKRGLLKISSILEFIYIFIMILYYIFFSKSSDEMIGNIFLLCISLCFAIMIYKFSNKEVSELKNRKILLYISSIWILLDSIIPGILALYFINSISDKKKLELPIIKEEKIDTKAKINAIILLALFLVFMFILPRFNFFSEIPTFLIYAIIFILVLFVNFKELKNSFGIFIKNIKIYIPYVIKNYFKMLGLMLVVAVPIVLINNGNTSNNQEAINVMFKEMPLFTILLSCLYAPFVEESLFRLNLSKLINNKKLFIVLSGFIFGLLHVIGQFSNIKEFLYIFQYSALGIYLAKTYKESNNIFVTISMHFMQNFLAAMLILLIY